MKARNRRHNAKPSLELVEEAVHVLRMAPGAALACYYAGTLPFVLGMLFFWGEMSRSPFAGEHLAGASLGLAVLFLWMKFWQAVFASHVRAYVSASAPPRWGFRRCVRAFMIQAALQPSAVVVLSLASVILVPLGWTYAFYQNVTALGDGELPAATAVFKQSWKQCQLWPGQNHWTLALLSALGLVLCINLCIVGYLLPGLGKSLLGIDSIYAQSPAALLNSTFLAAVAGLAYLCLDPVVKTVYVLRCFQGQSITSGEDLKSELKGFLTAARPTAALVLGLMLLCAATRLDAADPPATPPQNSTTLSAPELDRNLNDVIHQSKYTWRMPREMVKDENREQGPIARFFARVEEMMKRSAKSFADWLDRVLRRLPFRRSVSPTGNNAIDWGAAIKHLLILLLIAVVGCLLFLLFRVWQKSSRGPVAVASEAMPAPPDLRDENVGAEQLPEDGWIKLGRELLESGDLRLALRAFYFASLAHLAARGLITVARFKSNRDYERELRRRGHALPEVLTSFGENVVVFDRSWYGLHDVSRDLIERFLSNVERIKAV